MISFDAESSDYAIKCGALLTINAWSRDPKLISDNCPIHLALYGTLYESSSHISLKGLFNWNQYVGVIPMPSTDYFLDKIPYNYAMDKKGFSNPLLSVAEIIRSGLFHQSALAPKNSLYGDNQVRHTQLIGEVEPVDTFEDVYQFVDTRSIGDFTYNVFNSFLYDEFIVEDGIPSLSSTSTYPVVALFDYVVSELELYFANNESLTNHISYVDSGPNFKARELDHEITDFSVERDDSGKPTTITFHRESHFYHNDGFNCRYDGYSGRDVEIRISSRTANRYASDPSVQDGTYTFPTVQVVDWSESWTNCWYQERPGQSTCSGWEDPSKSADYQFDSATTLCGGTSLFDDSVSAAKRVSDSLTYPLPGKWPICPLRESINSYFVDLLQEHLRAGAFDSTQDAVEPFLRTLSSNYLENLLSLPSLRTGIHAGKKFVKVLSDMRRGKFASSGVELLDALTNAQLIYAFELAPTLKDAEEIAARAKDINIPLIKQLLVPQTLYGSAVYAFELQMFGDVELICRSKVRIRLSESSLLSMIFSAESVGLLPRLSSLWDLVPFSFVVDWFAKIGDKLDKVDKQILLLAFETPLILHSFELRGSLTDDLMSYFGWKNTGIRPLPRFTFYSRELSRHQPQYRDSILGSAEPTSLPYHTASSLVYQVMT